jgi:aspartyl-tRNA(Asn)/glutamyl-tRNA(Gln) amidotransferase subunit B
MRLEPNISLKAEGSEGLPKYKVEVKNINSFRFVAKAIEFEIKRQSEILDKGETPTQETRGWNESKNATLSQRSKEEAHDYRYFPEPDIPPIRWEESQISNFKTQIKGKLPEEKVQFLTTTFGISLPSATTIVNLGTASLYEKVMEVGQSQGIEAQATANYIINRKIDPMFSPQQIINDIQSKTSNLISDDSELEKLANQAIEENPKSAQDYKSGKENAIQALVGGVMRLSKGKADATKVKDILEKLLT